MTPEQAAEVRERAWTAGMRADYHPRSQHSCDCEYGQSTHCERGQHRRCHVGAPLPSCEGHLLDKAGAVLYFAHPYRHPSVSATGWHPTRVVMVWRAGRPCAWHCPCDCGHPGSVPAHAVRPAAPEPMAVAVPRTYELVALPGLDLAGVRG